jgi:hypothetical protein
MEQAKILPTLQIQALIFQMETIVLTPEKFI